MMLSLRLDGGTALVTGGAGGLGEAQAASLRRAGALVLLLDNRAEAGAAVVARLNADADGPPAAFIEADLAAPAAAAAILREAMGDAGIDILVNNAAINPFKPVEDYDLAEFERVQSINASAAFALAQAVLPGMKQRRCGRIINICSVTLSGWWKDMVPYIASKGTLLGMTRAMAREFGPWNIRVNAVSPGAIPTPLETEVWGDGLEEYERHLLERQALKFRGSANDIADAVLFLSSPMSRFVTGQNLIVDGGWWMS